MSTESRAAVGPTKVISGSDFHLTLLMVPMSLNLVTGPDRKALLDYAKAVWQASRKVALEEAASFTGKLAKDYASAQFKEEWEVATLISEAIRSLK